MEKRSIVFLVIVFSLFLTLVFIFPVMAQLTGDATGNVNISIQIIATPPTLTILSTKNHTYLTTNNLLLNFTAIGEQAVWYNLDNSANITISSFVYFNTTEGSHRLYLYANNSDGNLTSENVAFFVNETLFTILYSEYNGSFAGASIDFIRFSYEDIQNLSDIVLENAEFGKISFNEIVNLTDDSDTSDNTLDLDANTNVSFNRIELDSSALPNFDKSATLLLYNLTFDDPRVLKDGVVCPSSICVENSFSGGILDFNVTGFSVYSTEETPLSADDSSGGGGSDAGSGGITTKDFSIDIGIIQVSLKQGETKKEEIVIKNTGDEKVDFDLSLFGLEGLLRISEKSFELDVGESRTIVLEFSAGMATPDLYLGKLFVESEGVERIIPIALEVESKDSLFDVRAEIPMDYLVVRPGRELLAEIELFNIGAPSGVDVRIDYEIRDVDGNIIISSSETIGVETRVNFVRRFLLPQDIVSGNYILYVKTTYDGKSASASVWFRVREEASFLSILRDKKIMTMIVILAIVIILSLIAFLKHHHMEHIKILEEHKRLEKEHRGILKGLKR